MNYCCECKHCSLEEFEDSMEYYCHKVLDNIDKGKSLCAIVRDDEPCDLWEPLRPMEIVK